MRKGLIGFLAFSVIFLNGCLEGETSNKEAKLTANQAESERLAQAGEALLTPVSFMFADELFTQALNLDSQNMRAGLYKSILGPVMKTRGFMARIAPYISTLPENIQNNYRNASARMVQADVRDFYFNGPADLKTEIDVQNLLQEVVEQFSNARKYIRANKTRVIDLKATVYSTPAASDCKVQSDGLGGYSLLNCGTATIHTVRLAQPDLEVAQQMISGYQIYGTVLSAYDFSGYNSLLTYLNGSQGTEYKVSDFLRGMQQFGRLRANQHLGDLLEMGSDLIAGVRWAKSMQSTLCPNGRPVPRPGYALNQGICMAPVTGDGRSIDRLLDVAALALQGSTVDFSFHKQGGGDFTTQVQVYHPLMNPILDLKTIFPTDFDSCGHGLNYGDETLGGIFPRGDASKALRAARTKTCH